MRTQTNSEKKVLDYILEQKEPPGPDVPGRLQQSIIDIAKGSGVSVSTAHRTIDKLRMRGYFVVRPPTDKREPNIIEYVGLKRPGAPALVAEAKEKVEELKSLLESLENDYTRLSSSSPDGSEVDGSLIAYARGYDIVSVTDLPDGQKVVVLSPKEKKEGRTNLDNGSS